MKKVYVDLINITLYPYLEKRIIQIILIPLRFWPVIHETLLVIEIFLC